MKTYALLTCLFTPTMMFGMDQPGIKWITAEQQEKQQLLLDTIHQCGPTDEVDLSIREFIGQADINCTYPITALARAIYCDNLAVLKEVLATPGLNATIPITIFAKDAALHISREFSRCPATFN